MRRETRVADLSLPILTVLLDTVCDDTTVGEILEPRTMPVAGTDLSLALDILMALLVFVVLPAVALLWTASMLSRSSGERLAGQVFGIFGVILPFAADRFGFLPFRSEVGEWSSRTDLLTLLCLAAINSFLGALGAAVGVLGRRFLGRLLRCCRHRLPAERDAKGGLGDMK